MPREFLYKADALVNARRQGKDYRIKRIGSGPTSYYIVLKKGSRKRNSRSNPTKVKVSVGLLRKIYQAGKKGKKVTMKIVKRVSR